MERRVFRESSECALAEARLPPRAPHLPGAGGDECRRAGCDCSEVGENGGGIKKAKRERRGKRQSERGKSRGGWMESVTQMAKPLLWPTRSHPRASYMSAGASWPRRRRRAGVRRAGGRASQSRRPTPPPTAPPAPNGAGRGGGSAADPLLRPSAPARSVSPGSAVGAFPARALHAPAGRGRTNRGGPAGDCGDAEWERGVPGEDGVREGLGGGADSAGCCPAAEP